MHEIELPLEIGETLHLEVRSEDNPVRHTVHLIGYSSGQSVLVSHPERGGKLVALRDNLAVVVRSFSGGSAFAFESRVLRTVLNPYPYVHLSYPDQATNVVVRSARRTTVALDATICGQMPGASWSTWQPAVVMDLSVSGARIATSLGLGRGMRVRLHARVTMENIGPRVVALSGVVRTVSDEGGSGQSLRYGIEFDEPSVESELMLRAYMFDLLTRTSG